MKRILLLFVCVMIMITVSAAADGETDVNDGWVSTDGNWYYYQDGKALKGLQEITDDKGVMNRYYFSTRTGKRMSGWKTVNDKRYFFSRDTGKALKGLHIISGERYYFGKTSARMFKGWVNANGHKYFFSRDTGKAFKGKHKIGKYSYYFSKKTARRLSGWKTINGRKYYFSKKNFRMYKGMHKMSGNVYTFSSSGVLKRKVLKSKPAVCLTYDDGPSDNTYTILDTLKKYDGLATFFVVGNRVETYRGAVEKASSMGCQIANHTWSHPWLWELSSSEVTSQIKRCSNKVKNVTGKKTLVCRTPGGDQSGAVLSAVGLPVILWSIDTRDWETQNSSKTYAAVMNNVHDGDIVLMHDLYSATANASKNIIPALSKKGYQMVTIQEMAMLKGRKLKAGAVYYSFR